jgi:hypothetical protein
MGKAAVNQVVLGTTNGSLMVTTQAVPKSIPSEPPHVSSPRGVVERKDLFPPPQQPARWSLKPETVIEQYRKLFCGT